MSSGAHWCLCVKWCSFQAEKLSRHSCCCRSNSKEKKPTSHIWAMWSKNALREATDAWSPYRIFPVAFQASHSCLKREGSVLETSIIWNSTTAWQYFSWSKQAARHSFFTSRFVYFLWRGLLGLAGPVVHAWALLRLASERVWGPSMKKIALSFLAALSSPKMFAQRSVVLKYCIFMHGVQLSRVLLSL